MPNEMQAGVYAAILHYLKAVKALNGDTTGDKVVARMKEMPTDDPLFGKGSIRADGRKIHPMYLFEVKAKAEMKEPWDYYKQVLEIPGEQAFLPLEQGWLPAGEDATEASRPAPNWQTDCGSAMHGRSANTGCPLRCLPASLQRR